MGAYRVLLAEDHPDAMEILEYFVRQLPEFEIVGKCRDGEELIEQVMSGKPDLVLADIRMPGRNGIDSVRECLKFHSEMNVIFITGYDEYAVSAFELSAVDYLVKPIEKSRLYAALEKYKQARGNSASRAVCSEQRLSLKFGGSIYFIPARDIHYIEKLGRKCLIHTADKIYETYENMNDLLRKLDGLPFSHTHRSYIVNLSKVSQITPTKNSYIIRFYDTNQVAFLAKTKMQEVQDKLDRLCRGGPLG